MPKKKKLPRVLRWLAPPLLRLAKGLDLLIKLDRFKAEAAALGGDPDVCMARLDARAAELVAEKVGPEFAVARASKEILDDLRRGSA